MLADALSTEQGGSHGVETPSHCGLQTHSEVGQMAEILLIAPFWPRQIWFPSLRDLLLGLPVRLPDGWNLLRCPGTSEFYLNP